MPILPIKYLKLKLKTKHARGREISDFSTSVMWRNLKFLIYNSNGKLENVKAEVVQTARSLLELESLSDFKIGFRWKNDSLQCNAMHC